MSTSATIQWQNDNHQIHNVQHCFWTKLVAAIMNDKLSQNSSSPCFSFTPFDISHTSKAPPFGDFTPDIHITYQALIRTDNVRTLSWRDLTCVVRKTHIHKHADLWNSQRQKPQQTGNAIVRAKQTSQSHFVHCHWNICNISTDSVSGFHKQNGSKLANWAFLRPLEVVV